MAPALLRKWPSCFWAFTLVVAACSGGTQAPRPEAAPPQSSSLPATGVWDVQPHSFGVNSVTPNTRCEFFFRGRDGTYVGVGNAYSLMLFVVSRTGQLFPETVFYDVSLQSAQNRLDLKMRADAGRILVTPMLVSNDPNRLLLTILQSGFTLTVSGQNAGTVLVAQIPPPSPLMGLPFQACLNMVQQAMHKPAAKGAPQ